MKRVAATGFQKGMSMCSGSHRVNIDQVAHLSQSGYEQRRDSTERHCLY